MCHYVKVNSNFFLPNFLKDGLEKGPFIDYVDKQKDAKLVIFFHLTVKNVLREVGRWSKRGKIMSA